MFSQKSHKFFLSAAALVAALCWVVPSASAQLNTAALRGTVTSDGAGIVDAKVVLTHGPTGNRKVTRTNSNGAYSFSGLRVGGPYSISVTADGFLPQGVSDLYISAGKRLRVPVPMKLAGEVIDISGNYTQKSTSARSSYGIQSIEETPSIGRDPKDLVKLNPDAYIEEDSLSIAGANNRFNSVTVDGTRQDDDFGLNSSGYPTQRSPISLAAIEEITVEKTPFDVRYGKFLGGNVNIVTKSGTNEFEGQLITTFANQTFTGGKSKDDELDLDFQEIRYGATLGGPIVKDKLHFFVSVEGLDATSPVDQGPAGSGATNEVPLVTQAEVDRARDIAQRVYGFDAGVPGGSLDEFDLKLLTKIDWAVNDKHRMQASWQRTDGNVVRERTATDRRLPLTSNWYDRADLLNTVSAKFFSDWSENFSTKLEATAKLVDNDQDPLNGNDFMQADIRTAEGGTIRLGPDVFRHANALQNDTYQFKAGGELLAGDNVVNFGWEMDYLAIKNTFVPYSNGSARFDSLDDFENMAPSSIFYGNSPTGNPDDAAANWSYGVHAFYLQDQIELTDKITLQGGVRAELYGHASSPTENPNFEERHGFKNNETLNGRYIFLPRAGVSIRPIDRLNFRAGFGLYSGGAPNVWMSNNYTNDGISQDTVFVGDKPSVAGFNGRNLPAAVAGGIETGGGNVDALDPNFKVPSTWKAATGIDYNFDIPGLGGFGKSVDVKVDYTFGKVRHGITWIDLQRNRGDLGVANTPVGTLPDGRPFYDFDGSDGVSFNRQDYDMLLTNTRGGHSHTASVALSKRWDAGFSIYGAYAYQDVNDVNPGGSSRSVSNYGLNAVIDPNNPLVGTSIFERKHRFVGVAQFSRALIGDLKTNLGIVAETRSGRPFSYTFGDSTQGDTLGALFGEPNEFSDRNRMLFYVPKGDGSDVEFGEDITEEDFNNFLRKTGLDKYRGQIAPRNKFTSPWFTKLDLRFAQDLPNPLSENRLRFMMDIENFGNMLNTDWGRVENMPSLTPAVDVDYNPNTGKYIYSNLRDDTQPFTDVLRSVWRMQFTLMYDF